MEGIGGGGEVIQVSISHQWDIKLRYRQRLDVHIAKYDAAVLWKRTYFSCRNTLFFIKICDIFVRVASHNIETSLLILVYTYNFNAVAISPRIANNLCFF